MIVRTGRVLTTSLIKHKPQYHITNYLRATITSGSIYRAIGILAGIQIGVTMASTYLVDRQAIMAVDDYLSSNEIKENQHYQVAGIIKPGSIEVQRGSLNVRFILTDFEDELVVIFQGETKYEFKEGETLVLKAYTPDMSKKNRIIGIDYQTKHSMDGSTWADKVGANRNTYGLNSRLQSQM